MVGVWNGDFDGRQRGYCHDVRQIVGRNDRHCFGEGRLACRQWRLYLFVIWSNCLSGRKHKNFRKGHYFNIGKDTRKQFVGGKGFNSYGIQDDLMNNWRGFPVFTSGPVSPDIWVVIFPTGSGGLATNIQQYMIDRLNSQGIMVSGVHWMGCDMGEEDYGARYFQIGAWILDMMSEYGLRTMPVLYAQSRGGLQAFNFICEAPSMVTRYAALYPCTDPYVYPGICPELSVAHNKTQDEFDAIKNNQKKVIDRYVPNGKASGASGVSGCIWHGDSDMTVPKELTTDVFAPQAHSWVKTISGFGHQMPSVGLMDEILQFIQWGTVPEGATRQ